MPTLTRLVLVALLAAPGCRSAGPAYRPTDWKPEPGGWWLHKCGALEVRATDLPAADDGRFAMKLKNGGESAVTLLGVNLAVEGEIVAAWDAGALVVEPGREIVFQPVLKRQLSSEDVDLHFRLDFGERRQTCTMPFAR